MCIVSHLGFCIFCSVFSPLSLCSDEPGAPEISGFLDGEYVRAGENKTLTCRSRGGNPKPEVFWFKNGLQIDTTFAKNPRYTVNEYTFSVDSTSNNAKYECHVQNVMTSQPKKVEMVMRVQCKCGDPGPIVCEPFSKIYFPFQSHRVPLL